MEKINYAGVLFYAVHDGQIYLLVGKESYGPYADFGGTPENDEPPLEAALREAWEETMGLVGDQADLRKMILSQLNVTSSSGVIYAAKIPYDPNLPKLFANVYESIKTTARDLMKVYNKTLKPYDVTKANGEIIHIDYRDSERSPGFLEKTAVKWVTETELAETPFRVISRKYIVELYHKIKNYELLETLLTKLTQRSNL